LVITIEALM